MAKQLGFGEDGRGHLKARIDILAQAVKSTLGPKGRNVALDQRWGAPTITHDGVTVARNIELSDPFENMGAQLLKEAATKTNEVADENQRGGRGRHHHRYGAGSGHGQGGSQERGCRSQPHAVETRDRIGCCGRR